MGEHEHDTFLHLHINITPRVTVVTNNFLYLISKICYYATVHSVVRSVAGLSPDHGQPLLGAGQG